MRASLRALEGMLRRLISEDLSLDFDIAEDVGYVRVDPAGIEQVIINLVVNARDAVGPGGVIRIAAFNRTLDVAYHEPTGTLAAGDYVVLEVIDDGTGMTPAVQAKVFEPFFTTKPSGRGTGLGLSTVYGIVAQSDGLIRVESEVKSGSRFAVYLPRHAGEVAPAPPEAPRQKADLGGKETVLVAEDDRAVRELVAATLRRHGCTVLTAENGRVAATIAADHASPIAALVTDLVMPGLNGRELADRFNELRPGAVVIYMSRYADEGVLGRDSGAVVDLKKPFAPVELARLLRARLDQRRNSAEAPGLPL